ncbi:MAG: ABC transporter permease, partial [Methylocystis sp.]|nr:ABC transporter permease [Methylocystis sp.]
PLIQMLTWGFLQTYLMRAGALSAPGGAAQAAGTLIGAILLWDILLRGQQGFCFSFVEEMWSRNLPNILMSPLRPAELVTSLILMSLVRLCVGVLPVTFFAILFFGFNIWSLGIVFGAAFVVLQLFGWSLGLLVSGILMRFGLGAENIIWSLMFLVQPLAAVYYPVTTLPSWLQPVSWALPPTYVFESLRAALIDHVARWDLLAQGFAIDVSLFALASFAFGMFLKSARRAGALLRTGE